jgi:hypothetical protein
MVLVAFGESGCKTEAKDSMTMSRANAGLSWSGIGSGMMMDLDMSNSKLLMRNRIAACRMRCGLLVTLLVQLGVWSVAGIRILGVLLLIVVNLGTFISLSRRSYFIRGAFFFFIS